MVRQFSLRGMLMLLFPTRFTVNSFMRWLGFNDIPVTTDARRVLELMYLGLKHFRIPQETFVSCPRCSLTSELRAMHVPTLLLIGDHEVICDPATALARARRLIPDFQGELVPRSSHDMCFSQHRVVDARVLDFLKKRRTDDRGEDRQAFRGVGKSGRVIATTQTSSVLCTAGQCHPHQKNKLRLGGSQQMREPLVGLGGRLTPCPCDGRRPVHGSRRGAAHVTAGFAA